jgi:transposase-like protein
MGKKVRRQFTDEQKRIAVDDYVSGRKTAAQVAAENDVPVGVIYRWRVQLDEKAKGARIDELEAQGMSPQAARKIQQQEAEIEEYQKKVAQQAIIIDLLKKLQPSTSFQPESELTGLIDTTRKLARSKRHAK